jgi:dynein heavy chain 2
MARDLMTENRRLRRVHTKIIEEVQALKNIDLLRSREIWEQKLNEVNSMVDEEVRSRNIKFCQLWLKAINDEIYSALEYQYRLGLESLNENLPEI